MVRIISALILAATAVCATAAEPLELVDNPPERHVVVKGDTLWAISGKFLKKPWRWPEIWQLNKDQIKNPHLIYPGDVVWLDLSSGNPRLRLGKPVGGGTVKLQPKIYESVSRGAVSSIPVNLIEPFISNPLIIEEGDDQSVRIVATQEDRVISGNGDNIFATGISGTQVVNWHIFRPGKPLKDPETGKIVAHEAFFLGSARLIAPGDPATLTVTQAKQEITRGDWLKPAPEPAIVAYVPRKPDGQIDARIMSIYGGAHEAGAGSVVALSRGTAEGVENGHVLAIFRKRVSKDIDLNLRRVETEIPEERYGLAFVFRTFEHVAYALIMESSKSVIVGDATRNP